MANDPRQVLRVDVLRTLRSPALRSVPRITWRFVLLIVAFSTSVYLDEVMFDSAVMDDFTAFSAHGVVIALRAIGVDVFMVGQHVSYRAFAFAITPECTGYEVLELYAAAVIAVPLPWASRLRGLAIGLPVLSLINLGRMMWLVVFGAHRPEVYDIGHFYAWPVLLLGVALGMWLMWIDAATVRVPPDQVP